MSRDEVDLQPNRIQTRLERSIVILATIVARKTPCSVGVRMPWLRRIRSAYSKRAFDDSKLLTCHRGKFNTGIVNKSGKRFFGAFCFFRLQFDNWVGLTGR